MYICMHMYPYAEQTKRKYLKSIGHFFAQKNYQHINAPRNHPQG